MKTMKLSKLNFKYAFSLMASLLFVQLFTACQEEEGASLESETVLDETVFAENFYNGITSEVEEAIDIPFSANGRIIGNFGKFGCATRSVERSDEEEYPLTITLDYGEGCNAWNGATISGKIITTISGPRKEVGTVITTTFEDLLVNEQQVEGTHVHTVVSETEMNSVEEVSITTSEGETFTRNSTRTRKQVEGADTEERSDDVFETTGSSSGQTPEGVSYSKSITTPLLHARDCPWIGSGVIENTVDGVLIVTDFGDGTCDNIATNTVDGETEEIEMDFKVKRFRRHLRR
ncbi:hypothetical protein PZB74_11150 [Porifericola rhodea]|uniref:hypothetical protein n=1 Tax=Porifericola rhodea TaxID=930972 RepID=UPI002666BE72|nr:hypothetical protein [Porifericola rhodea]WKN33881.1 hypothetical protein PZB74_11150 [Porifericola rhodea]